LQFQHPRIKVGRAPDALNVAEISVAKFNAAGARPTLPRTSVRVCMWSCQRMDFDVLKVSYTYRVAQKS